MKGRQLKAAGLVIPFEDAELVDQCQQGDAAAFGRLVLKYQDRVFNACWRMCGNRADAEEFAQEAFVRALQSIDRFGKRARFSTWVFRIAMNLVISARRRKRVAGACSLDSRTRTDRKDGVACAGERLAAADPSPQECVSNQERNQIVVESLNELEDDYRAMLVLRDVEGFDYAEIAEMLDVPTGTVKSRLHRARLALREKLAPILGTC